ncbi:MAG: hypothetical protein D6800_07625, partial [Candidatus Zixiibacteriota bacterium]
MTATKAVKKTASRRKAASTKTVATKKKKSSAATKSKSTKTVKGQKYYYFFGDGKAEGSAEMRDLLGGKGANLAEMTNTGIPVPPGFTMT